MFIYFFLKELISLQHVRNGQKLPEEISRLVQNKLFTIIYNKPWTSDYLDNKVILSHVLASQL